LAHACIAVSGSVGLELLHHSKPSIVLYRLRAHHLVLRRLLIKCRYIGLVNLLADEEILPEFVTHHCPALDIGKQILHWLDDPIAYGEVRGRLSRLRERVGQPGACEKAARYLLDVLSRSERPLLAAG
jgi:lipid-A-disaccharide synthase